LPPRAAWAVLAAAGIYGDIAREVARRGGGAWDDRVVTRKAEKLAWVAKAGVQAIGRARRWPRATPRPSSLWTRPR
jgi:phytoene synthase